MIQIAFTKCCGIQEIHGITTYSVPEVIAGLCIYRYMQHNNCAAYYFVDRRDPGMREHEFVHGVKLEDFILQNKLGAVYCTHEVKNPNSGNYLRMYTWIVDNDKLKEYWATMEIPAEPKEKIKGMVELGYKFPFNDDEDDD